MTVQIAKLRTGTEVPDPLVRTVTLTLSLLMNRDPIAFYEAVMMARNPGHEPFGTTAETLHRHDFIDVYPNLHRTVRDVILASVDGEDFDLHLVSPYAEEATS